MPEVGDPIDPGNEAHDLVMSVFGGMSNRCRFPAEYALVNRITHPLNVCLREDAILADVDGWLTREFAPRRLRQTITDLVAAQDQVVVRPDDHGGTAEKIAACDYKLTQYRAALDAGARPVTVAGWIAETEAERARHEMSLCPSATRARMSEEEIEATPGRPDHLSRGLRGPGMPVGDLAWFMRESRSTWEAEPVWL